jgi:CRISPR system Cascade subunit CasA
MPINLISDPWLPIRHLSGHREWIRPADVTSSFVDDSILALDFPRPDWNAAVTEMLIGLLACVMAPEDNSDWASLWEEPPTPEELGERLAPLTFAFHLRDDHASCFQDYDSLADCEAKPVSALLIDAPGANALTKNADLFVKRATELALCPAFAAAALITMQTYAPAGGQGNRTSMRGGGPLTTLPLPRRNSAGGALTTLWDAVWASVPCRDDDHPLPEGTGKAWATIFPWLTQTLTSQSDRSVTPEMAHPLQCYFATPRRIRLCIAPTPGGICGLGGGVCDTLVTAFRQKNLGVKYEGWLHPHSPYYTDKKSGKLPYHPQPGGATYRDWLTWLVALDNKASEPAAAIRNWAERVKRLPPVTLGDTWQSGVLACGFDMDNMKARGWLEARIPYFDSPRTEPEPARWCAAFFGSVNRLVAGADDAGRRLRFCARLAKFGSCDASSGSYSLPKTSPGKDAFDDLYEAFWRETEADFLRALDRLREDPADAAWTIRRDDFCYALRRKALALFDEIVGTDNLADQDARRIVEARSALTIIFSETGSVRNALGIVTAEAQAKTAKGRSAKKKELA